MSILSKAGGVRVSLPVTFPAEGEWLVRVMATEGQFVFGMYRRPMKTIGYLGQIDKLFAVSRAPAVCELCPQSTLGARGLPQQEKEIAA